MVLFYIKALKPSAYAYATEIKHLNNVNINCMLTVKLDVCLRFSPKVGSTERFHLTLQLEYLLGFICTAVYFIILSPLTK